MGVKIKTIYYLGFLFGIAAIACTFSCNEKPKNDRAPKVEIGHRLFFDTRMSFNNTKSCASCHAPEFAFTDGYKTSIGSSGEQVLHNAPSLLNISKHRIFDWANPNNTSLLNQIQRPLYGQHPVELGLNKHLSSFIEILNQDSVYTKYLQQLKLSTYTKVLIEESIVAYIKELNSQKTAYHKQKLNIQEQRGMQLFNSDRLKCNSCHGGQYFTVVTETSNTDSIYINSGLYNNKNNYPESDNGIRQKTGKGEDDGKFKIPSLINVGITAPYFHDGSAASLLEVISHYEHGGRKIKRAERIENGHKNRLKDKRIGGFKLSAQERSDLVAFLYSLTDTSYLNNPIFTSPFLSN